MSEEHETGVEAKSVTRAEWASAAAFLLSAASAVWTGGVLYGQIQSNTFRITGLEARDALQVAQTTDLKVSLAEIKANVQFLTDRAREDRAARSSPPE